jgi:D-aspartate ligase
VSERAVVFGLLWAGLALTRSLGRRGLDVRGIALAPHEFGLRSRFLREGVVVADDEAALAAVRAAAADARVVLFPERDAHVAFCLRHWDELRDVAALPYPDDPGIVERLRRKESVTLEAERAGVALPRTAYPDSESAVRELDLRPPLLVKPVAGQEFAAVFGEKLFVAEDAAAAAQAWERARAAGFETVVQELIPDAHDKVWSLFTYIGRQGEPLANVVGRKLRSGPPRFGTAAVFELRANERALDTGLRLLRSAGYRGFAQVELAHDTRDDELKLLEVNTRPPQWGGIAMTRRYDVAKLAYDDLLGRDVRPLPTYTDPDVRWIYLAKDAWSSLELARRGELGLGGFLAPYTAQRKVRAIFAADDPLPGLASLAYLRTKVA